MKSMLLLLIGNLLLAGCARHEPHTVEFLAMGTAVEITVADSDITHSADAVSQAQALIQRLGHDWYPWTPDHQGELVALNKSLHATQPSHVSAELAALLVDSKRFCELSNGAFDPGVGRLVEMWGFETGDRSPDRPVPSETQVVNWVKQPDSIEQLRIDGLNVSSSNPHLTIDLGAIAKGRVVDLAAAILQRHGLRNFIVNAGGNLRALGTADGRAWRVAIKSPRDDSVIAWLEMSGDESVSTSGDYVRYVMVDQHRYHHLLDPATGRPTEHTESVTVIARDATVADAASTALFVSGPDHWTQIAHAYGVSLALRVDASGRIEVTRALQRRLQFIADISKPGAVSVVDP